MLVAISGDCLSFVCTDFLVLPGVRVAVFIRESVTSVLAQNIVICKKTIRILYVAEEGKTFAMIGEDLTP